jgi:hypothetical protein
MAAVLVPAVVLAVVAAMFLASTRTGIGLTPDSVSYVEGARSLADGDGYSRFVDVEGRKAIVDFPPLYSATLAPFEVVGVDLVDGARVLNAILLVGTALLMYVLTLRMTSGHRVAALLAASAFGLSMEVLRVYGFVWSESLFLLLLAAWALALDTYLRREGRVSLVAVAALGAAALLTRYAGVAVLVASIIAIAAFGPGGRGRRVRDAAIVTGAGVFTALGWALRNRITGVEDVFSPAVHGIPAHKFGDDIDVVASWFFPAPIPDRAGPWLSALLLAAGVVGVIIALTRRRRRLALSNKLHRTAEVLALAIFAGVHVTVLVASFLFLIANQTFTPRFLAPVFLVLIVLAAVGITRCARPGRLVGLGVLGLLVIAYAVESADTFRDEPTRQRSIIADVFAESELLDIAPTQPQRIVYSDRPEIIYANTGMRNVQRVPRKFDQQTLETNPAFETEVRRMGSRVRQGKAIVVMWHVKAREQALTAEEHVARVPGLGSVSYPKGTVFYAAQFGPPSS